VRLSPLLRRGSPPVGVGCGSQSPKSRGTRGRSCRGNFLGRSCSRRAPLGVHAIAQARDRTRLEGARVRGNLIAGPCRWPCHRPAS
jgi:hypothetical protein